MATEQEIPIEYLDIDRQASKASHSKEILLNEIDGIRIFHFALGAEDGQEEQLDSKYKFFYLFIKGTGSLVVNDKLYNVEPESIFLPNAVLDFSIQTAKNDTLHFIKISCDLTAQDILDLEEFPKKHTEEIYFTKFADCEAYTEAIKSPTTISRTVLPNKYIPRVALGTVKTKGPDQVAPHEHPMLEQLFLGLTDNQVIVTADDLKIDFPAYSILHIPLGSSHSVEVIEGEIMHYIWMDFFLDKKGEEWLETHKAIDTTYS